jgi:ABC-type nitrate/sulfonate/bicarbonate transport system substrate-binding protein
MTEPRARGCCWPAAAGFPAAPHEDSVPFRIAANIWPGYEPLHLAAKLGYFAPLPVTVHEMPSSSASLHAFRNRTVDAAALTLDETLLLAQDGIDLRIILILDVSNGADVLMARPEITQPADLRGRRIGVENTALGAYVLSRALEQAGLLPTEVQVVSLTVDRHEEAYLTGEVDAVVTFEPVRTKLLDRGARILFDSRRLPDEILRRAGNPGGGRSGAAASRPEPGGRLVPSIGFPAQRPGAGRRHDGPPPGTRAPPRSVTR